MLRPRLVLLLLYLGSVCCINSLYDQLVLDEDLDDIDTICNSKLCIPKCCGINEFVDENENSPIVCGNKDSADYINGTDYANGTDYTNGTNSDHIFLSLLNVPLYDNYYHNLKINKTLSDVFLLKPGKFREIIDDNENNTFWRQAFVGTENGYIAFLSEDGILYLEYPNAYYRWTPVNRSNLCIDINEKMIPKFWTVIADNDFSGYKYYAVGLIISSVFLIIVLLVYMVLPELRNLAGLVLMAYVFSLVSAFISLASLQLGDIVKKDCIILSGVTYFFFLSSFCWMSVLSYDIWWTFRSYAKARVINRLGKYYKFVIYGIYAWGVPMVMTIGLIEVNNMDLLAYPWIVKPLIPEFGCFLYGGQKFVYFYIPMLILIFSNWIFYLMTAFNIWRLVRGTSILNSAHRSQKNRFIVYLKLSVVMGINWLLEVVSFLTPELKIWTYTDSYNLLVGFFIFLIFICKQKIYRKLKARFMNMPMVHKYYHNSTNQDISPPLSTNSNVSDVKETMGLRTPKYTNRNDNIL